MLGSKREPSPGARKQAKGRSGRTPPRQAPRTKRSSRPESGQAKDLGPLVLIAEDFLDTREMYADILRFHGYRTVEASNGEEAIQRVLAEPPAIILMDLAMPCIDGFEAIRMIRSNPHTRNIPIIVITAHGLPSVEEKARAAGCDSFLTKSIHPQELVFEIRRVLEAAG